MFKKSLFIVGATIVLALIGLVCFPVTGIADDCVLQGAWYGKDPSIGVFEWIINVQGQSHSSGTTNIEDPFIPPGLYQTEFADANRITTFRGVWERTGARTFDWTMLGYGVVDGEGALWLAKMSGTSTLMKGCDEQHVAATFDVFYPWQDPYTATPTYSFKLPPDSDYYIGYRVSVDHP